jgi:hypothetical protein
MDELSGLASSLAAGVGDVRGCLILSRDGLVVSSYLKHGEGTVKPAWIRFAAVGEPERGYVQFGTETWCYVRRAYAAFVVAGPSARPELVIDHMDQLLQSVEGSRINGSGERDEPAVPVAPSSKPRAPLHPEVRPVGDPVGVGPDAEVPVAGAVHGAPALEHADRPTDQVASAVPGPPDPAEGRAGEHPAAASPGEGGPPEPPEPSAEAAVGLDAGLWELSDNAGDVDRFSLAREFRRLLQDEDEGADG